MTTSITFTDRHEPTLKMGHYRVHSEVGLDQISGSTSQTALDFTVGGPLQPLLPAQIGGVFPPAGAIEDHTEVLPHIVLTVPTIPWSRLGPDPSGPWLGLLVHWESDGVPEFTGGADALETVTLPGDALNLAAPLKADLHLLAHVRASDGVEHGVVLGGRMPMPGGRTICMLVDLRGAYSAGGAGIVAAGPQPETLTVLHRWEFSSLTDRPDFATRMKPVIETAQPLRHPPLQEAAAEALAAQGFSVLAQDTRDGGRRATLFRGPFSGAKPTDKTGRSDPGTALTADALLEIDRNTGLIDASYAGAWQIGRLIGLASTGYATALAQHRRSTERRKHLSQRFVSLVAQAEQPQPDILSQTLAAIARLDDVPFAYLVPDPAALPPESLRLFEVDPHWILSLVAGAESLGRGANDPSVIPALDLPVRGFLLRSGVVRDFPAMTINGIDGTGTKITSDQKRLGPDTVLGLFHSDVDHVEFYLHPQALHHGLPDPLPIKNSDGTQSTQAPVSLDDDALWHGPKLSDDQSPRKPDFVALAAAVSASGSGALALQLVDPSHKVQVTFA